MAVYELNQGDLHQLGEQELFLRHQGFNVDHITGFPALVLVTKEEYISALRAIYDQYVDGWWNYQDECVRHRICTEDEFKQKFKHYMQGRK